MSNYTSLVLVDSEDVPEANLGLVERLPVHVTLLIGKLSSLLLLVFLAACSPGAMMEKIANPEKTKIAREYLQRLMDGDATLTNELEPKLRTGNEVELMKNMRALIPPGTPTSTELVGYQAFYTSGQSTYNVTFQFGYPGKWIVANAAWRESPNKPRELTGMRVTPLEHSLQATNAFSFQHAGFAHYVILTGLIIVAAFTIFTLVVCIRTKFPRRKWMWIIFVMVGAGQFSINWATGETEVRVLAFQLFGAGAFSSGLYAPWILSVSVPLGAIAFWYKRKKLTDASSAVAIPPPLTPVQ